MKQLKEADNNIQGYSDRELTLCAQTIVSCNHIFKFCAYTYESNTAQIKYFCYVLYDSYLLSDNHLLLIFQMI